MERGREGRRQGGRGRKEWEREEKWGESENGKERREEGERGNRSVRNESQEEGE